MTSSGALQRSTGSSLRAYRITHGQTLIRVSRRAGISVGHLCEIERGEKHACSEVFRSICDALGVAQSFIINDTADRLEVEEQQEQQNGVAA